MPFAFHIPGNKHTLHNLQKDCTAVLKGWKELRDELLKPLVDLLRYDGWRERLVQTCIKGSGLDALFSTFPHSLEEWVWDAVAECIETVHTLSGALKQYWSLDKFLFKDIASVSTPTARKVFTQADKAIRSEYFWAYLEMMRALLGWITSMSCSHSNCACHEDDAVLHNELKKHRLLTNLGLRNALSTSSLQAHTQPQR
jgi:hypothetical protein